MRAPKTANGAVQGWSEAPVSCQQSLLETKGLTTLGAIVEKLQLILAALHRNVPCELAEEVLRQRAERPQKREPAELLEKQVRERHWQKAHRLCRSSLVPEARTPTDPLLFVQAVLEGRTPTDLRLLEGRAPTWRLVALHQVWRRAECQELRQTL